MCRKCRDNKAFGLFWTTWKRCLVLIFYQFLGLLVFLRMEEELSIVDCFQTSENISTISMSGILVPHEMLSNASLVELSAVLSRELHWNVSSVEAEGLLTALGNFTVISSSVESRSHGDTCLKWFDFTLFTLTTIGYGNVTPVTTGGRMFLMLFAAIGIPITIAVLSALAECITTSVCFFIEKCCCLNEVTTHGGDGEQHTTDKDPRVTIATFFVVLLWALFILFMCALIDTRWHSPDPPSLTFLDLVYFYFVSFTTIGYGDILPGRVRGNYFLIVVGLAILSGLINATIDLMKLVVEKKWNCLTGKQRHSDA